jgi:uroporphyrinogen III methyltransferase/synthase
MEDNVDFNREKTGCVILVGAGPGDSGLLTVKGREALTRADCILYDRLASWELLSAAKEGCELIYVGKADHRHVLPQEKINELLVQKAHEYSTVVRLKGGDSYVFGRGGEECLYLRERGIACEVIPGVTSAIAGPASAGIPITHRGVATGFHVMTAHGKEDRLTDIDFSLLTDEKETCVFLMGLRHIREVADSMIGAGRRADTPVAVISHATTDEQRTCIGTLADIAKKAEREALTSPAIIVVGDVVSLSGRLGGRKDAKREAAAGPSKTYIVPYIRGLDEDRKSLAAMLRGKGVRTVEIPVGEIRRCPLMLREEPAESAAASMPVSSAQTMESLESDACLNAPAMPDWLIFTSRNAVDAFFPQLLEKGLDVRALCNTKIAAVGEHTVAQLKKYGLLADFIPSAPNGRTLGPELFRLAGSTASVWYIKGREGGTAIAEAFRTNPNYREITVYENCEACYDRKTGQAIREQIACADGIFFTSASCVRRICRLTDTLPGEIYSIGPTCTKQLRELGYTSVCEASRTSYEGLVECIASHVFEM